MLLDSLLNLLSLLFTAREISINLRPVAQVIRDD